MKRARTAGAWAIRAVAIGLAAWSCAGNGTSGQDAAVDPDLPMDLFDASTESSEVPVDPRDVPVADRQDVATDLEDAGPDGRPDALPDPDGRVDALPDPGQDHSGDPGGADAVNDTSRPPSCPAGEPCDDGDSCTFDDTCVDDVCRGTAAAACADALDCTEDVCTSATECTHDVKPGWCLVDGVCFGEGQADPANACLGCVSAMATDRFLPDNALPCSDGNGCTGGDRCVAGTCMPGQVSCDDGDPCTDDQCEGGECINYALTEVACDDGDPCTSEDTCASGSCAGTPLDCDDGNLCTEDSCSFEGGCVHVPIDGGCDDDNACTVGDACVDGTCASGGEMLVCDNPNPCLSGGCVPSKGCVFLPNTEACDDDDPCTLDDVCHKGECLPGAQTRECPDEDGNPCTDETCQAGVGCVSTNSSAPCIDGDPCTVGDTCGGGTCHPGAGDLDCDDANPCTDDACVPGVGCSYENNTGPCDDPSACVVAGSGVCRGDGTCRGTLDVDMCDDEKDCTVDLCDPVEGCHHKALPECRPQIVIDFPPRGATLDSLSAKPGTTKTIQVRGHVETGREGAMIPLLTINGVPKLPDAFDRSFTFDIDSAQGFNPIVVDAEDVLGARDHLVQSYYFSTEWHPADLATPDSSRITDGLMMFLGPKVWDDGDRTGNPNSIADIIVLYLKTLNLMEFIDNPMASGSKAGCEYEVNINSIEFNRQNIGVTIVPIEGGLSLQAQLNGIVVRFRANLSNDPLCVMSDFNGTVTVDWLRITMALGLSVDENGTPVITPGASSVAVGNLKIDSSNWLADLILGLLEGTLKDALVDAFQDQIDQIVPTLQEALAGLAINTDFTIPAFIDGGADTTLGLRSALSTILCHPNGCTVGLKAAILAPHGVTHPVLGSIGRAACLTGVAEPTPVYPVGSQTPAAPALELGLHDDFFNEIPYALYWAGALTLPLPASLLGGVDLSSYNIEDLNVAIDLLLPPILSTCNDQQALRLQIGDLGVLVSMKLFGMPVEMQLYASMEAAARMEAVDGPDGKELSIAVDQPSFLDIEIASLAGGLVGAEDALGDLIRTVLVPKVLESLTGKALGTFPIPSLDLSGMIEGLPADTKIAIEIREILRDHAYTVLSGNVK